MGCLNKTINFNIKKLKNNLSEDLNKMIKLEFELDLNNIMIERISKSIKSKINECFNSDCFIYRSMDNKYCTHKFRRGKQDGYFCCKKINTNLNNEKEDYLCVKHSKKHIPKKRIDKNKENVKDIVISNIKSNDEFKMIYNNKKDIKKIFKKKKKNKNKIHFICNFGVLNISKILTRLL